MDGQFTHRPVWDGTCSCHSYVVTPDGQEGEALLLFRGLFIRKRYNQIRNLFCPLESPSQHKQLRWLPCTGVLKFSSSWYYTWAFLGKTCYYCRIFVFSWMRNKNVVWAVWKTIVGISSRWKGGIAELNGDVKWRQWENGKLLCHDNSSKSILRGWSLLIALSSLLVSGVPYHGSKKTFPILDCVL